MIKKKDILPVYRDLNILGYGGGVNTWALLLEATARGILFDFIIFADTDGERPETYAHIEYVKEWCKRNGQPEIITVEKRDRQKQRLTLYNESIESKTLPSAVYGYKNCSLKHKKSPQDVFCNNNQVIQSCWANGFKVNKYLGFDADEEHRTSNDYSDDKYNYIYPLVEWDWGRFECVKRITDAGEPLPPKSSCFYCPSMKPWEIIELYLHHRGLFYAAVEMERIAAPNLKKIDGLGRHWSWWDIIVAYRYFRFYLKNPFGKKINPRIRKMVKRIQRSRPEKLRPMIEKNKTAETLICDIFKTSVEACPNCMT
jgi:hypothetical protein